MSESCFYNISDICRVTLSIRDCTVLFSKECSDFLSEHLFSKTILSVVKGLYFFSKPNNYYYLVGLNNKNYQSLINRT